MREDPKNRQWPKPEGERKGGKLVKKKGNYWVLEQVEQNYG